MAYTEEQKETELALLALDAWGSTSRTDSEWHGFKWNLQSYAPEWLTSDDLDGADPSECVTALGYFSLPEAPDGWRLVYHYNEGEHECPWCEASGIQNDHEGRSTGEQCGLCDGDQYLGDECTIVCVFAPVKRPKHWVYGSGSAGCLYDSGPDVFDTKEAAIEHAEFMFSDCLGKGSLRRMRAELEASGDRGSTHYFDRRIKPFAGADYCEIIECDCDGHDHPEGED